MCRRWVPAGADLYVVDGAAVFFPGMVLHVARAADPDRRQLAVTCAGGQGDGAGQDCQISSGMRGQMKEGGGV